MSPSCLRCLLSPCSPSTQQRPAGRRAQGTFFVGNFSPPIPNTASGGCSPPRTSLLLIYARSSSVFSSLPPDTSHPKFLGCPWAAPYRSGMPARPAFLWGVGAGCLRPPISRLPLTFCLGSFRERPARSPALPRGCAPSVCTGFGVQRPAPWEPCSPAACEAGTGAPPCPVPTLTPHEPTASGRGKELVLSMVPLAPATCPQPCTPRRAPAWVLVPRPPPPLLCPCARGTALLAQCRLSLIAFICFGFPWRFPFPDGHHPRGTCLGTWKEEPEGLRPGCCPLPT